MKFPETEEAKTYIITLGLGILISFIFWGLSYHGWGIFHYPGDSFPISIIDINKAVGLETLLSDNDRIRPFEPSQGAPEIRIYINYWDKILYAKNQLVFKTLIENKYSDPFWYPSILVLIMDSRDYVRGKTLIQLIGDGNGIPASGIALYSFHFQIPDDIRGEPIYIKVFLYGERAREYPGHTSMSEILEIREYGAYGRLPYDIQGRFTQNKDAIFRTFALLKKYMFNIYPIASSIVAPILFTLSFRQIIGEKLKIFLGTNIGILFILIILIALLVLLTFFVSMFFY